MNGEGGSEELLLMILLFFSHLLISVCRYMYTGEHWGVALLEGVLFCTSLK